MRTKLIVGRFTAAALVAVVTATCGPAPEGAETPAAIETTKQAIAPLPCPYTEVVVDQAKPECEPIRTAIGTWVGEPVGTYLVRQVEPRTYCRYQWVPENPQDERRPPLEPFSTMRAQVDCPLVAPSAPVYDSAFWKPMEETFRAQIGRTKLPGRKPVTIAVIDSAVHPFEKTGVEDNSGHGRAVGRAIFDVACAEDTPETCPAKIANHLALRELGRGSKLDPKNGGFFGTRGQVASAISRALDQWTKEIAAGRYGRLIVNVSLGWAQNLDGNPTAVEDRTLPADAVYRALQRASCLGALTVAAAGNGIPPNQTGPLHPAAWEQRPAPTPDECRGLVPDWWPFLSDRKYEAKYKPLVVAVGGVDHQDIVLATTRRGGQPRLVAQGMTVVTNDPRPASGHTMLLSGSSMAAAAVSGVIAAGWGLQPEMPAHALLERVYETGVILDPQRSGGSTQFCFGGACGQWPIRRVSACSLVESFVGDLECKTVPAHGGVHAPLPEPTPAPTTSTPPRRCYWWPWGGPICFPIATTRTGSMPTPTDEPWVRPQPTPTCPSCLLHKNSRSMSGWIDMPNAWSLGVSWGDVYTSVWGASPVVGLYLNSWFNSYVGGWWSAPSSAYAAVDAYGVVGPAVWSEGFPLPMTDW